MGTVYRALDRSTGRVLTLRASGPVVQPTGKGRSLNEVRLDLAHEFSCWHRAVTSSGLEWSMKLACLFFETKSRHSERWNAMPAG